MMREKFMNKIIRSGYNEQNRCGYFLLNLKKIKLTHLLDKLELKNVLGIIEQTDGKTNYSSLLFQIIHDKTFHYIYRVDCSKYQQFEEFISNDNNATVLLVEISNSESEKLLLNNIDNLDQAICDGKISKCIIDINKFESEIFILLKDIEEKQFKKIKDVIKQQ